MAYYLRKTKTKKGIYLQIYFSYRDPISHKPKSQHHKTLGYVSDLQKNGIDDPVSFYQSEVEHMNQQRKDEMERSKHKKVSKVPPERYIGYLALQKILQRLRIEPLLDYLQTSRDFHFSVYKCMSDLIFARATFPCSKRRTVAEVLPRLWDSSEYSYPQILSCLDYLGENYSRIVELFTSQTLYTYDLKTDDVFFDCTNYYFEIDREDEWRRKGPSKENRHDPIIGMGLLLSQECIPIGMKLYPGNQSEKPIIRDVIKQMKRQQGITGKTIQVADKGLNCAQNIIEAINDKDGYLFSKSVKQLPQTEQVWVLNQDGYKDVLGNEGEVLFSYKSCIDEFYYHYTDENGRKYHRYVKEKRLATFNPSLAKKQEAEIDKMVEKALNCRLCEAKRNEYGESAKYVIFSSSNEKGEATKGKVVVTIDQEKIEKDKRLCGYNLLVTSEVEMKDIEIYDTYHQLWRIEESFRSLKSELNARPVYLQNINRIHGHFLICYLTLLLERLFQFKMLENRFGTDEVFDFIRSAKVVELPVGFKQGYMNLTPSSPVGKFLEDRYHWPIQNAFLNSKVIKKVLDE